MNAGGIALLVAVVGVAGTLLAPITTTWVGSRARLQEFELQQRADQATRLFEEAQRNLERRRDTYVAVNTSARAYRILLMEDLQALRRGTPLDANGATEASRVEFQNIYAQAQMLVPNAVLETCQAVRVALGPVRRIFVGPRRLARHLAALSESSKYVQYEDDPPPCDAPHQPPRADPRRSAGQDLADARKQIGALLEDTTLDLEKWQDVHTHLIQL